MECDSVCIETRSWIGLNLSSSWETRSWHVCSFIVEALWFVFEVYHFNTIDFIILVVYHHGSSMCLTLLKPSEGRVENGIVHKETFSHTLLIKSFFPLDKFVILIFHFDKDIRLIFEWSTKIREKSLGEASLGSIFWALVFLVFWTSGAPKTVFVYGLVPLELRNVYLYKVWCLRSFQITRFGVSGPPKIVKKPIKRGSRKTIVFGLQKIRAKLIFQWFLNHFRVHFCAPMRPKMG